MELSDYIRILRKNWLVIVIVTLLGLGAAATYSLTRTPLYESRSTVVMSTSGGGTVQELQQGNTFTQARVATYVNLVTKPVVMDKAIAQLGLSTTVDELATQVTATNVVNTTLITIGVQNPDPALAAATANALASSLTSAVQNIEPSTDGSIPVKLTVVETAEPALTAISPNVPLNLALGTLIGLALGVSIAVVRNVLDNKVRSIRDIQELTDRPLIGVIPYDPKAQERPIILQADPHNPRSEAFRALRTNLQFLEMDGGHTFVVTSSVPSEGKSTTTVNLAVTLADAGNRVALIDTDLRKPKVAEYLNIEGGAGLTDVLIGRAKVSDVMLPWGRRPLFVLPAGKVPPNPSELLGSKQMTQLLEAIAADFDIVLLDAPPLLPVTDAAILAKQTSGALVVAAAGRVTTGQFGGALTALETVEAKVAGVVLTMVPTRGADAYGHGYGYGYGYGGYGTYTTATATIPAAKARRKDRAAAATARPEHPIA